MTLTPAKIYIALVRRLHFLVLLALMVPCYCLIVTYGLPAGEAERIKKATVQATDGKAELLLARELEYRIVDGVVERETF